MRADLAGSCSVLLRAAAASASSARYLTRVQVVNAHVGLPLTRLLDGQPGLCAQRRIYRLTVKPSAGILARSVSDPGFLATAVARVVMAPPRCHRPYARTSAAARCVRPVERHARACLAPSPVFIAWQQIDLMAIMIATLMASCNAARRHAALPSRACRVEAAARHQRSALTPHEQISSCKISPCCCTGRRGGCCCCTGPIILQVRGPRHIGSSAS